MSYNENDLYSAFGIENSPAYYCYMNSTLQMLFTVVEFRKFILNIKYFLEQVKKVYGSTEERILNKYCFYQLYKILKDTKGVKNTNGLKAIIKERIDSSLRNFKIDEQNDAEEFLNLFLKILHSEFYRIENAISLEVPITDSEISTQRSFISHFFKLKYKYYMKYVDYADNGLIFPVNSDNSIFKELTHEEYLIDIKFLDLKDPKRTLQYLLNTSLASEYKYDGINDVNYLLIKRFCDFPMYLILRIARFDTNGYGSEKICTKISIPKTINIFNHSYNIISIICHHGQGIDSGHYTAFAERKNHWYHFNDTRVENTCFENIIDIVSPKTEKKEEDKNNTTYLILCKMTEEFQELTLNPSYN